MLPAGLLISEGQWVALSDDIFRVIFARNLYYVCCNAFDPCFPVYAICISSLREAVSLLVYTLTVFHSAGGSRQ